MALFAKNPEEAFKEPEAFPTDRYSQREQKEKSRSAKVRQIVNTDMVNMF